MTSAFSEQRRRRRVPCSIDHSRLASSRCAGARSTTITSAASRLFLVLLRGTLGLSCASELLGPVLALFPLLSAGLLDLGGVAPGQVGSGARISSWPRRCRRSGETRGFAATVLRPHAEDVDLVFVGFVNFGELRAQVILGHVRAVGVQDVNDHLLAREKSVGDELAGSDGNWRVGHSCGVDLSMRETLAIEEE